MRFTLQPVNDSYDLVAIRKDGAMCGTVHIDTFIDALRSRNGSIYERLWEGKCVEVELVQRED